MTFSLDLADVRIDQVTEVDRWPFPPAELFPGVAVQAPDVGEDELVLAIHTYVVRHGDLTVLIDAGNGNAKQRPVLLAHHEFATDYLTRLAAVGVRPEDIDVVVATRLHPDHAGGSDRR
ncbi:MAG: MBL fold metallo-hydrolase [Nakamurella sp.]